MVTMLNVNEAVKKIVKYEGACQIINSETLFFNVNDFFLNLS